MFVTSSYVYSGDRKNIREKNHFYSRTTTITKGLYRGWDLYKYGLLTKFLQSERKSLNFYSPTPRPSKSYVLTNILSTKDTYRREDYKGNSHRTGYLCRRSHSGLTTVDSSVGRLDDCAWIRFILSCLRRIHSWRSQTKKTEELSRFCQIFRTFQ